jgi:hypothetical protein
MNIEEVTVTVLYDLSSDTVQSILKSLGMPKITIQPYQFSFIVSCHYAVKFANALRRIMQDELEGKAFHIENPSEDIKSTSKTKLVPRIYQNICNIPIHMNTDPSRKFSIKVENLTTTCQKVYSRSIDGVSDVISPMHDIMELSEVSYITIPNIHISTGKGTNNAKYQLCSRMVSFPVDCEMASDEDTRFTDSKYLFVSGCLGDANKSKRVKVSGILKAGKDASDVETLITKSIQDLKRRIGSIYQFFTTMEDYSSTDFIYTESKFNTLTPADDDDPGTSTFIYQSKLIIAKETHTVTELLYEIITSEYNINYMNINTDANGTTILLNSRTQPSDIYKKVCDKIIKTLQYNT